LAPRCAQAETATLIDAPYERGNEDMAQDFMNSGSARLAREGRAWAKKTGTQSFPFPPTGREGGVEGELVMAEALAHLLKLR